MSIKKPTTLHLTLLALANELNSKVTDITVTSGAALYIMGLRDEYDDIDVEVSSRHWDIVYDNPTYKHHAFEGVEVIEYPGNVDIHLTERYRETEVTDGIRHLSPAELLTFKEWLSELPNRGDAKRKQDLRDIAALRKLIEE